MRILFNGKIIYNQPFATATFNPGWNNSMGCYYPNISICKFDANSLFQFETIDGHTFGMHDPCQRDQLEIIPDMKMLHELETYQKRVRAEDEAKIVRHGKYIEVVRGRKLPIGTRGDVFWLGDSGYGPSVGIRLHDGKRVFTALTNVEVVSFDSDLNKMLK